MDYTYPEKEAVRLDSHTEKTLREIKNDLGKVLLKLENLNQKVEALENGQES
jgi:hypothetical protein